MALFNLEAQLNKKSKQHFGLQFKRRGRRKNVQFPSLTVRQVSVFRNRNLHKEDVLTYQLLHGFALLRYQTADIIYKLSNGNYCNHFIISMSS